jgi:uncharacterized protein (DUF58 family)
MVALRATRMTDRWPLWRRRDRVRPAAAVETSLVEGSLPGSAERLLRRLDLAVVRRLDGLRQGEHPTDAFGPGLDLADLRPYAPGDDVRSLDWNVTARTGTPHIRRYHEDRDIGAWLLLDLTGSMAFGSGAETKASRLLAVTGTLARLLQARGDRVGALLYGGSTPVLGGTRMPRRPGGARRRGLAGFDGARRVDRRPADRVGAASGRTHVLRLLQRAVGIAKGLVSAAGQRNVAPPYRPVSDLATLLDQAVGSIPGRALVFLVTDALDSQDDATGPNHETAWARSLRALASRHDVTGVIVRDARDGDLPDVGVVTFVDLETGEQMELDTAQMGVRLAYASQARRRHDAVERAFTRAGALAWEVTTAESVVGSIVRLLETRRRMATGLRRAQVAR